MCHQQQEVLRPVGLIRYREGAGNLQEEEQELGVQSQAISSKDLPRELREPHIFHLKKWRTRHSLRLFYLSMVSDKQSTTLY